MKKVLAFSGSNSSASINQKLIRFAAEKVQKAEVTVVDLRDYNAPIYSMDLETESGIAEPVKNLLETMSGYDGFLISSPEHNGSTPAFFKNIIDWLSRADRRFFNGKPIMVMGASPGGSGAGSARAQVSKMFGHFGGKVVAEFGLANFHKHLAENDELSITDADTRAALDAALKNFEAALTTVEA